MAEALNNRAFRARDIVKDRDSREVIDPEFKMPLRIFRRLLDKGIIARAVGASSIALCPPYVIERDDIDNVLGAFRETVDELVLAVRIAEIDPCAARFDDGGGNWESAARVRSCLSSSNTSAGQAPGVVQDVEVLEVLEVEEIER